MNIIHILISILFQFIGLKKLWQFKILFKYFPDSSKLNIVHDYFGTKYSCTYYDEWTMIIHLQNRATKRIIWEITSFEELPKFEQERRIKLIK